MRKKSTAKQKYWLMSGASLNNLPTNNGWIAPFTAKKMYFVDPENFGTRGDDVKLMKNNRFEILISVFHL